MPRVVNTKGESLTEFQLRGEHGPTREPDRHGPGHARAAARGTPVAAPPRAARRSRVGEAVCERGALKAVVAGLAPWRRSGRHKAVLAGIRRYVPDGTFGEATLSPAAIEPKAAAPAKLSA